MDNPVFVIGLLSTLQSLARSVGRHGIECWACASNPQPGLISRYARYARIPDPREDEEGMVDAVIALARRQKRPPVIFTGSDQHAQALARHRDRLREVAIPCIGRGETVDLLIHKGQFSEWARTNVPSYPNSTPAAVFEPGDALPFPVIAKPNFRNLANGHKLNVPSTVELNKRRFTLIEDAAQWETFKQREKEYLPHLLIQEFVRGDSASKYSVGIYADARSDIRAMFVGRRLRGYPALYGDATLVQSDEVPEAVIAEVRETVKALRFEGIAEFEYNQHEVTGAFRLLEINPRCWGWIGITTLSCCDVPLVAYRDLTGQQQDGTVYGPKRGSLKMVYLVSDAINVFLRYPRHYPRWALSPLAWWRSLRADNLVIFDFDPGDLRGTFWCVIALPLIRIVRRYTAASRPKTPKKGRN